MFSEYHILHTSNLMNESLQNKASTPLTFDCNIRALLQHSSSTSNCAVGMEVASNVSLHADVVNACVTFCLVVLQVFGNGAVEAPARVLRTKRGVILLHSESIWHPAVLRILLSTACKIHHYDNC